MPSSLIEYVLRVKDEASSGLDKAADSASTASTSFDGMADSAVEVQDAAGEADSIMQGLAGAVEQFNPAAGAAIRVLGDMAGGMEAVARGAGSFLTILGPLAVALGAIGAAYVILKGQQDAARESMKLAREEAERMEEAVANLARQQIQAAVATGDLTEEQALLQRAALDASDQWEFFTDRIDANKVALTEAAGIVRTFGADYKATFQLRGLAKELEEEGRVSVDVLESIAKAGSLLGQDPMESLRRFSQQLTAQESKQEIIAGLVAKTEQAIIDQGTAAATAADSTGVLVTAEQDLAESSAQGTARVRSQEAALVALSKLRSDLAQDTLTDEEKLERALKSELRTIEELRRAIKGVEGAEADLAAAREAALEKYDRKLAELTASQDTLATATEDAVSRQEQALGGVEQGVGIAQGATSGGAAGVASAFGPIGAIVAAVLGILESVGELGAEGLAGKLESTNQNIVQGIRELPALMGEEMPAVINEFIEELILALSEELDDLGVALIEGTFDATTFLMGELPGILVKAIITGVGQSLQSVFSGEFFGGGNGAAGVASFFTGGVSDFFLGLFNGGSRDEGQMSIDRTGLFLLHEGEQVVSRGGRSTQAAGPLGGADPTVALNVSGVVSPAFLDFLSDQMREAAARGLTFG